MYQSNTEDFETRSYKDFCINNPWLNVSQEGVRIGKALDTHYIITATFFYNNAGVVTAVVTAVL